jgi:hypothetical protein
MFTALYNFGGDKADEDIQTELPEMQCVLALNKHVSDKGVTSFGTY